MKRIREAVPGGSSRISVTRTSSLGDGAANSIRRISLTRWLSQNAGKKLPEKEGSDAEFLSYWGITRTKEVELLAELRVQVEKEVGPLRPFFDDMYLRRFLRARGHDVGKAKTMFLNHLKFRKENKVDTVLEDFDFQERDAVLSIYPQGYHKTDKEGRPVYIQHLGQVNLKSLHAITTEDRMLRYHVQEYERCLRYIFPACSKVAGHYVATTFTVLDLKGVGLRHLTGDTKRILGEIVDIDSSNYPETLGKTLIINAPSVFKMLWAVVKPMLDSRTQAKIQVCSSNYLPELRKWVDEENIPAYLGGKSKGSLVDDVGPWQLPQLIAEIDAENAARDGLPPPKSAPVPIPGGRDAEAEPEPKRAEHVAPGKAEPPAKEQGKRSDEEEEAGAISPVTEFALRGPDGHSFLRQESMYVDAEEYYDAASRKGSITSVSYLSGEESAYSSPRGGWLSGASSPSRRYDPEARPTSVPTVPEGEALLDIGPNPTVSVGSRVAMAGEEDESPGTVAKPGLGGIEDGSALKAGLQIPILARVRALEQRFPDVERRLRRQLEGDNLPSRNIGTGTLLSRVAALERAMDTLLVAQETVLEDVRQEHPTYNESSRTCGCCTVM